MDASQAHSGDGTDDCFWWRDAPPRQAPSCDWQPQAETAIVGCGYAGLAAAICLARANRNAVILEKKLIGEGASGRNGGITSGNLRPSHRQLVRRFGPERGTAIADEAVAARADLRRFIEQENVACDFVLNGRVTGISGAFDEAGVRAELDALAERHGIDARFLGPRELAGYTSSRKYRAGILRPDIGTIHPAKMLHEMVRIAVSSGARIFSSTAVRRIVRRRTGFVLSTDRGDLQAEHVVSAGNAYTDEAQPWLRRRLVPVVSEIIATESLGENQVRALMPGLSAFGESTHLGYYYRPSPDGRRILLGGRRMHRGAEQTRRMLEEGLAGVYPDLAGVPIEHHWGGPVAFPFDQLPKLTVHDGIIHPTGFCGSGTVWARWLGQKAAGMILGRDAESQFSGLPMRTVPFYRGDPWFLPLAMSYYKMRDRLAARRGTN